MLLNASRICCPVPPSESIALIAPTWVMSTNVTFIVYFGEGGVVGCEYSNGIKFRVLARYSAFSRCLERDEPLLVRLGIFSLERGDCIAEFVDSVKYVMMMCFAVF